MSSPAQPKAHAKSAEESIRAPEIQRSDSVRSVELDGHNENDENTSISPKSDEYKPPHTVLTVNEKYVLVLIASSVSIWSAMGSPIYYPALGTIEKQFDISEEMVNISVVVYFLCQGTFPTISAGLADIYGRRPVILASLVVFIGASIGVAVTRSYTVLLILRCIQSAGISPTVAVGSGVVGDFTERHERGSFMGIQGGLTLLGQAFGPLIGAGLIAGFDWRAIFWFLAIGGGCSLCITSLILPETKRTIVGNGSVKPRVAINVAPILLLPYYKKKWKLSDPDYGTVPAGEKPDLLAPLKILVKPEVIICLMNGAIHFACWTVSLTCLTTQLAKTYGYSVMTIGLCYLPVGMGGLIGSVVSGKLLDLSYRKLHKIHLNNIEKGTIPANTPFNVIRSRIVVVFPFVLLGDGFCLIYGWCLYKHVHIAVICVTSFFLSLGCLSVVNSNMTLMVDLYPSQSSAAASCVNLTRCLISALFVGVLTYMNKAMTVGGTLTFLPMTGVLFAISLIIPMKYANKWREARELKAAAKADSKADK
ncbi:CYFA0S06e00430g1_1 [Cyberlindnera fabianii]|uniref:CYFA0S06e00430g1_1 n=1 Tax=Cyberlindnera fabianii TaxID=36022 RepID=A0A061AV42_CYBFA|nr:CYFA0S06e00430g1_1 [Cyberlindnera fabianii]